MFDKIDNLISKEALKKLKDNQHKKAVNKEREKAKKDKAQTSSIPNSTDVVEILKAIDETMTYITNHKLEIKCQDLIHIMPMMVTYTTNLYDTILNLEKIAEEITKSNLLSQYGFIDDAVYRIISTIREVAATTAVADVNIIPFISTITQLISVVTSIDEDKFKRVKQFKKLFKIFFKVMDDMTDFFVKSRIFAVTSNVICSSLLHLFTTIQTIVEKLNGEKNLLAINTQLSLMVKVVNTFNRSAISWIVMAPLVATGCIAISAVILKFIFQYWGLALLLRALVGKRTIETTTDSLKKMVMGIVLVLVLMAVVSSAGVLGILGTLAVMQGLKGFIKKFEDLAEEVLKSNVNIGLAVSILIKIAVSLFILSITLAVISNFVTLKFILIITALKLYVEILREMLAVFRSMKRLEKLKVAQIVFKMLLLTTGLAVIIVNITAVSVLAILLSPIIAIGLLMVAVIFFNFWIVTGLFRMFNYKRIIKNTASLIFSSLCILGTLISLLLISQFIMVYGTKILDGIWSVIWILIKYSIALFLFGIIGRLANVAKKPMVNLLIITAALFGVMSLIVLTALILKGKTLLILGGLLLVVAVITILILISTLAFLGTLVLIGGLIGIAALMAVGATLIPIAGWAVVVSWLGLLVSIPGLIKIAFAVLTILTVFWIIGKMKGLTAGMFVLGGISIAWTLFSAALLVFAITSQVMANTYAQIRQAIGIIAMLLLMIAICGKFKIPILWGCLVLVVLAGTLILFTASLWLFSMALNNLYKTFAKFETLDMKKVSINFSLVNKIIWSLVPLALVSPLLVSVAFTLTVLSKSLDNVLHTLNNIQDIDSKIFETKLTSLMDCISMVITKIDNLNIPYLAMIAKILTIRLVASQLSSIATTIANIGHLKFTSKYDKDGNPMEVKNMTPEDFVKAAECVDVVANFMAALMGSKPHAFTIQGRKFVVNPIPHIPFFIGKFKRMRKVSDELYKMALNLANTANLAFLSEGGQMVKLNPKDFQKAVESTNAITTFMSGLMKDKDVKFSVFGQSVVMNKLKDVEVPMKKIGKMKKASLLLSEMAQNIQSIAVLKMRVDPNGLKYRYMNTNDFLKAAKNAGVITAFMAALFDDETRQFVVYGDNGQKQAFAVGGIKEVKIKKRVVKNFRKLAKISKSISDIALQIQEIAQLTMPIYDKNGKKIGKRFMNANDLLNASQNVALIVGILAKSLSSPEIEKILSSELSLSEKNMDVICKFSGLLGNVTSGIAQMAIGKIPIAFNDKGLPTEFVDIKKIDIELAVNRIVNMMTSYLTIFQRVFRGKSAAKAGIFDTSELEAYAQQIKDFGKAAANIFEQNNKTLKHAIKGIEKLINTDIDYKVFEEKFTVISLCIRKYVKLMNSIYKPKKLNKTTFKTNNKVISKLVKNILKIIAWGKIDYSYIYDELKIIKKVFITYLTLLSDNTPDFMKVLKNIGTVFTISVGYNTIFGNINILSKPYLRIIAAKIKLIDEIIASFLENLKKLDDFSTITQFETNINNFNTICLKYINIFSNISTGPIDQKTRQNFRFFKKHKKAIKLIIEGLILLTDDSIVKYNQNKTTIQDVFENFLNIFNTINIKSKENIDLKYLRLNNLALNIITYGIGKLVNNKKIDLQNANTTIQAMTVIIDSYLNIFNNLKSLQNIKNIHLIYYRLVNVALEIILRGIQKTTHPRGIDIATANDTLENVILIIQTYLSIFDKVKIKGWWKMVSIIYSLYNDTVELIMDGIDNVLNPKHIVISTAVRDMDKMVEVFRKYFELLNDISIDARPFDMTLSWYNDSVEIVMEGIKMVVNGTGIDIASVNENLLVIFDAIDSYLKIFENIKIKWGWVDIFGVLKIKQFKKMNRTIKWILKGIERLNNNNILRFQNNYASILASLTQYFAVFTFIDAQLKTHPIGLFYPKQFKKFKKVIDFIVGGIQGLNSVRDLNENMDDIINAIKSYLTIFDVLPDAKIPQGKIKGFKKLSDSIHIIVDGVNLLASNNVGIFVNNVDRIKEAIEKYTKIFDSIEIDTDKITIRKYQKLYNAVECITKGMTLLSTKQIEKVVIHFKELKEGILGYLHIFDNLIIDAYSITDEKIAQYERINNAIKVIQGGMKILSDFDIIQASQDIDNYISTCTKYLTILNLKKPDDMNNIWGYWDLVDYKWKLTTVLNGLSELEDFELSAIDLDSVVNSVKQYLHMFDVSDSEIKNLFANIGTIDILFDKYHELFETINTTPIVKEHKRQINDVVRFIDKANKIDVDKIQNVTKLMGEMARFSESISGNFDSLAETLNKNLITVLEELRDILEETNNVITGKDETDKETETINTQQSNTQQSNTTQTNKSENPIINKINVDTSQMEEYLSQIVRYVKNIKSTITH